jgi:acyl-CoA synthetase (AMP-forming)/AMP-acid ligase II
MLVKDPVPSEDLRVLWPLPLFVIGGIVNCILMATVRGGTAIIMKEFDAAEALELLTTLRVTVLQGVPTMFERIAELEQFPELIFELPVLITQCENLALTDRDRAATVRMRRENGRQKICMLFEEFRMLL